MPKRPTAPNQLAHLIVNQGMGFGWKIRPMRTGIVALIGALSVASCSTSPIHPVPKYKLAMVPGEVIQLNVEGVMSYHLPTLHDDRKYLR